MSLSKLDILEIERNLVNVVQARENICRIVNQNCKECPLNINDKCSDLNLKEFDFKNNQWVDNI
ncbi:hypothetical protein [Clostridium thermobutyricum]|uniref:hypothetical protein n=1 Tax=Clostridium thermobutyricum TaxID=29372 RepID=UPI0029430D0D|nr:hypothetical protein [Clostridium thermobutyricum]